MDEVNKHWEKKHMEQEERMKKHKEAMAAAQAKGQNGGENGQKEVQKVPLSGTRQGLEAKARERIAAQIQAESDRVKKVGKEAEGKGE